MSTDPYQAFRSPSGWRGYVHGGWQPVTTDPDPFQWFMKCPHELVHDRPMSRTWRVAALQDTVFVKLVSSARHGGITPGRLDARIKQMVRPSVALRTLRMGQHMAASGLRVPEVMVAAHRRTAWHHDDLLACRAANGVALSDIQLNSPDDRTISDAFDTVGRRVAHLHALGFVHGHLLPGHILICTDQTDVLYLDNDETRYRPRGVSPTDRCGNLTQMVWRLIRWRAPLGQTIAHRFLDAYFEAARLANGLRRRCRERTLHDAHRRAGKR